MPRGEARPCSRAAPARYGLPRSPQSPSMCRDVAILSLRGSPPALSPRVYCYSPHFFIQKQQVSRSRTADRLLHPRCLRTCQRLFKFQAKLGRWGAPWQPCHNCLLTPSNSPATQPPTVSCALSACPASPPVLTQTPSASLCCVPPHV